jgi:hypothetical protein
MKKTFTFLICLLSFYALDQVRNSANNKEFSEIKFKANKNQKYGFDEFQYPAWKDDYQKIKVKNQSYFTIPNKSVGENETDFVDVFVSWSKKNESKELIFKAKNEFINYRKNNDSIFTLILPKRKFDYSIFVYEKHKKEEVKIAQLNVKVYSKKSEKVYLVPLNDKKYNQNEISKSINQIFYQANLEINLVLKNQFKTKIFSEKVGLSLPDSTKNNFTGQMRLLRDLYFEANPNYDKKAHYIFIVDHFKDSLMDMYMPKNKSIGFVSSSLSKKELALKIARSLGFGIGILDNSWENDGPDRKTTNNLMDENSGKNLTSKQWFSLQHYSGTYSFYDSEENIKTNNGIVAYYFWEEDSNGNLILNNYSSSNPILNAIKRPYKKNFLSYRFDVKYKILKPFYKLGKYYISLLNFIILILSFLLLFIYRKKTKKYWERKAFKSNFLRRLLYLPLLIGIVFICIASLELSNYILDEIKIISGPIEELKNLPYKNAKRELLIHPNLAHKEERTICSEILIKKNKLWAIKKRMKVLYFEVKQNEVDRQKQQVKLISTSDSLILSTLNFKDRARTHYMVFSFLNEEGKYEKQEIYSHLGINLTKKIQDLDSLNEPSKRILVFVNGYRPTSIGHTFEENFRDIKNKGFEHPNSKNHIFNFDRYDYWRQWNEINLMFQKRLNPHETYYADGHFSVSTSNYKNIINFTQISNSYPKRCKNLNKHTCHYIATKNLKKIISNKEKTTRKLTKFQANRKGFNLRRDKGRIAGRNLLQILNESPNSSLNDTIDIIAHSMGFAYSLGMIDELRGKINFGSFYIIAPENAKSGRVNLSEWQEIWQYGSNLKQKNADAPCLQDGVAPQSKAKGLNAENRIFIPEKMNSKKGFFDSHFIGYFYWILDIPEGENGYVKQK